MAKAHSGAPLPNLQVTPAEMGGLALEQIGVELERVLCGCDRAQDPSDKISATVVSA
jgi:hypothetical protein